MRSLANIGIIKSMMRWVRHVAGREKITQWEYVKGREVTWKT
jgi:hypothetical protein